MAAVDHQNGQLEPIDFGYTHGYLLVMLDHRKADRSTVEAAMNRQLVDDNLRPLLDLVARLLAEEFRASTVPAPATTATYGE